MLGTGSHYVLCLRGYVEFFASGCLKKWMRSRTFDSSPMASHAGILSMSISSLLLRWLLLLPSRSEVVIGHAMRGCCTTWGNTTPNGRAISDAKRCHKRTWKVANGPRHSGVGAIAALERFDAAPPARIVAYCIAGHHSGLADWCPDLEHRLTIEQRERELYRQVCTLTHAQPILGCQPPHSKPSPYGKDRAQLHLWVRMLFSCLVDADVLDTERFMQPDVAAQRGSYPSLDELRSRYSAFIEQLERSAQPTPLNQLRRQIRLQCIKNAAQPPGFFSLVVPTGGGKTLASIGFALEHAARHGLQRIIVAIPYTSIIEQTAAVLRYGSDTPSPGMELFGSEAIVEHHSNLDPEEETLRSRLATENWDAPIIVTTTVQLFESLFGCRPSQLRKLHNIARSVIILDEAQLLPAEHLRPLLSVLQGLVDYFGCTVLLMTATLPVLEGTIGSPPAQLQGIKGVRAIIENPRELAQKLDRVELVVDRARGTPLTWEELARELGGYSQVLCIGQLSQGLPRSAPADATWDVPPFLAPVRPRAELDYPTGQGTTSPWRIRPPC